MALSDLFAVTREDGIDVYINTALVRFIEPFGTNKSRLHFAPDHSMVVNSDPPSLVRQMAITQMRP